MRNAKTQPSDAKSKRKRRLGLVYVFESELPDHTPNHVKIGSTKGDLSERQKGKGLERCNFKLVEVGDSSGDCFDHFLIVEALIKAELYNCRKKFQCSTRGCRTTHEEWYEIDKADALRRIARWRRWIQEQEPFDSKGELTPYWDWKVDRLKKNLGKIDWDVWTRPSHLDYWNYQLEESGNPLYRRLSANFARKDSQFLQVGIIILLLLYILSGKFAVVMGVTGLVAL